jgi:hypothetical protein
MGNFLTFMFFWVLVFAWLMKIAGANVYMSDDRNEDYGSLGSAMMQVLETFRNTLGDLNRPADNYWRN